MYKRQLLDREKSFSVLSLEELGQLTSVDHYPCEEFVFSSYGCDLHIDNAVSYTHLDVYKRQVGDTVGNVCGDQSSRYRQGHFL